MNSLADKDLRAKQPTQYETQVSPIGKKTQAMQQPKVSPESKKFYDKNDGTTFFGVSTGAGPGPKYSDTVRVAFKMLSDGERS